VIAARTIGSFLASLAAREPAPGGGASAALHAAQAAALVAMVANYSDRGEDEGARTRAAEAAAAAHGLVEEATELIQRDIDAFGAVAAAYRLPREGDAEKAQRRAAIAQASIAAAAAPDAVIAVAGRVLELAEWLHPVANRNVVTDIAAAADAARAAASIARVNVEINLGSIADDAARQAFEQRLAGVDELLARADALTAQVRTELP
jgi:formiminotetrahydrofolate cyclodeaminase